MKFKTVLILSMLCASMAGADLLTDARTSLSEGKVTEAGNHIAELLRAPQGQTPEALYFGAQLAEWMGDTSLALTRYRLYVETQTVASPEFKRALEYLLQHGAYPDLYEQYVKVFGTGVGSSRLGVMQINRLLDAAEGAQAKNLLPVYLNTSPESQDLTKLFAGLRNAADTFELGRTPEERYLNPMQTLLKYPLQNVRTSHFYLQSLNVVAGQLSPEELVETLLKVQAQYGDTPMTWQIFHRFGWIRNVKDDALRIALAEKYLALQPIYTSSPNPTYAYYFLRVLVESPQAFKHESRPLVTPDQVKQWFADYIKASEDQPNLGDIQHLISQIIAYWVTVPEQRAAFMQPYKQFLSTAQTAQFYEFSSPADPAAFLTAQQAATSLYHMIQARVSMFPYWVRDKRMDLVAASVPDYLQTFPIDFNINHLLTYFVDQAALTPEERLTPFLNLAKQGGGANPQLAQFVEKLATRAWSPGNTWGDHALFQELKALVDAGKPGTDPLLSAYVLLASTPQVRESNDEALNRAAKAGVDAFAGTLPADLGSAVSVREIQAHRMYAYHTLHGWNNPDALLEAASIWGPKLGPGSDWGRVINRLADHNKDTLVNEKILPLFLKVAGDGSAVVEVTWSAWARILVPAGAVDTPFVGFLDKMEPMTALWFVRRQLSPWDSDRPFLFRQLDERVAAAMPLPSNFDEYMVLAHVSGRVSAETPAPVRLVRNLYQSLKEARGYSMPNYEVHAYLALIRSGLTTEASQMASEMMASLQDRPLLDQISLLSHLMDYLQPEEALPLTPGSRYHLILQELYPRIQQVSSLDYDQVTVNCSLGVHLSRLKTLVEGTPHAAAVDTFSTMLVDVFQVRNPRLGHWPHLLDHFDQETRRAVEAGDWPQALKSAQTLFESQAILGGDWNSFYSRYGNALINWLSENGGGEIAYLYCDWILGKENLPEAIRDQVQIAKSQVAQGIPGLIPVDQKDPLFDLYQAAQALDNRNEATAWKLTSPKISLLRKKWKELPVDYVVWSVEQMRKQKALEDAQAFTLEILLQESELTPDQAAEVSLIKGDIFRDSGSYQQARIEYESMLKNKRYQDTEAGQKAKRHLIELMIETRDYSSAEMMLERMAASPDIQDQAEAYYLYALSAYEQEQYEVSMDYLKEVFKRSSDYVDARLLEGELKLKVPRGLSDTEVAVGNPRLRTVAIPGRTLTLKLQDANLSVARGGASIPVIVTTDQGGDREAIKLYPSPNDPTLFVGTIQTALGTVTTNNLLLEVRGNDTVSYIIDPVFQKANDLNYEPKNLDVRSSAELSASAGEILSREEQEQRELEEQMNPTDVNAEEAWSRGRNWRTIRPGSPVYVQVIDPDQDMGPERDTVMVDLATDSGDILNGFVLTETEPHSGIFQAAVPTDIPLPLATASDTQEGSDPSVLINQKRTETWSSLADGETPKWVEVDTMSSHSITSAFFHVQEPEAIQSIRLEGVLAQGHEELAEFPVNDSVTQGGLIIQNAYHQIGHQPGRIRRIIEVGNPDRIEVDQPIYDREATQWKGRNGWISTSMKGAFYLPESRTLTLRFLQEPSPHNWQHAYMYIDGRKVLGGSYPSTYHLEQAERVTLGQGIHTLEVLVRDHFQNSRAVVGYEQEDGSFAPLPAEWFSTEANPELADYLNRDVVIHRTETGFKAEMTKPLRLRSLRWVVMVMSGNAITASELSMMNEAGEQVVPVQEDFSEGKKNRTLEIAPGDQITITYRDTERLDTSDEQVTQSLNSSFMNGSIVMANEEIITNQDHRWIQYEKARRGRRGDQVIVMVNEYDEDLTDGRDTVSVRATTSSGETLEFSALETATFSGHQQQPEKYDKHSGTFLATLKFGDTTGGNTLRVVPGDEVTVSYVDQENTDPGIPIVRSYSLFEAGQSEPDIDVYLTAVDLVPDNRPAAKDRLDRMIRKGLAPEGAELMKEQITAVQPDLAVIQAKQQKLDIPVTSSFEPAAPPARVSSEAPLLFEINYPAAALHLGSILNVQAVAESELKAARASGREPEWVDVPMPIQGIHSLAYEKGYIPKFQLREHRNAAMMLEDGSFAGIVRLQIGSYGDPVDDLVVSGNQEFAAAYHQGSGFDSRYRIPTMLVSGSDIIHLKVQDVSGQGSYTSRVQLVSDGRIELLDSTLTYNKPAIHFGQRFNVRVSDPDQDRSDERDIVTVQVNSSSGETLVMELTETLSHSGVFSGRLLPIFRNPEPVVTEAGDAAAAPVEETVPVPGDGATIDDTLQAGFGDELTFSYTDPLPLRGGTNIGVSATGRIFLGADLEMASFTKQFQDPEMAVKTRFLLAEALFEMAKNYRNLGQLDLADEEIGRGKRILEEAMRDYPDTSLAAQGEFLLANLAQELENYQEAIGRYSTVISQWPDSVYAARSQFKKAICLERLGNDKQASEEYVKLTYLYPESGLVADATVRLGNFFYQHEKFKTAGRIFYKFQQNNPDHRLAPKSLFLAGQCYMRQDLWADGIKTYELLLKTYDNEHDLRSEAMYWAADAYGKKRDFQNAYKSFKKLTWDYPDTKWAKIARGRLTEDVFGNIEANE